MLRLIFLLSGALSLFGLTLVQPKLVGQPAAQDVLAGVWEARDTAGPLLRGRLTVWEHGDKITAEIGGLEAQCSLKSSRIDLQFPNDLGKFKGAVLPDGDIEGFWIQPSGTFLFGEHASPTRLLKKLDGMWSGTVVPLDDVLTLYLVVTKNSNGKLSAYIRSPEGNVGRFWNAKELIQDSNGVRLMGQNELGPNNVVVTEVARGTYDKEREVLALYFPFRGASFAFTKVDKNPLSGFYTRPLGARTYHYRSPRKQSDGWNVGSAAEVGLSLPKVEKFVQMIIDTPEESVHSQNTHGVLIARNGKLVLEEYFHGFSADKPHDLRSASKSITSVLAGIAMHESNSLHLETPIVGVLRGKFPIDDKDPRKGRITVENLLTMSAGLDCDDDSDTSPGNENTMQNQDKDPDWYHYALNVPMAFEPGAKAVYGSALPNLLGGVIAADRHVWLPEYFRDKFAKPLELDHYYLPIAPNGQAYMGGGVYLRPRDFLKLGQMMLDGGTWRGKRVLEKTYTQQSAKPIYELEGIHYGFLWWVTEAPFAGKTVKAFFAGGNGGQVVLVVPELSLVFCSVGGNYGDSGTFIPQREWLPKFVLPMIETAGK